MGEESEMSTIGRSVTCADDGATDGWTCWLEEPCIGTMRVVALVLEGLRFFPAKMSSKVGVPWLMRGVSDEGAYAINQLLLLVVGGLALGACK